MDAHILLTYLLGVQVLCGMAYAGDRNESPLHQNGFSAVAGSPKVKLGHKESSGKNAQWALKALTEDCDKPAGKDDESLIICNPAAMKVLLEQSRVILALAQQNADAQEHNKFLAQKNKCMSVLNAAIVFSAITGISRILYLLT